MNTNGPLLIRDNLRYQHSGYLWPMRHKELYEALGLDPKRHLPDAGLPERMVGNVRCWVVPKIPGKSQDAARVKCICPHCNKWLTAGKFHQHFKMMHKADFKAQPTTEAPTTVTLVGGPTPTETIVVVRRFADGKCGLLGFAGYVTHHGWRFIPHGSGRFPSRRFWPTWEACLPDWVGYPGGCETMTLAQWKEEQAR
jgi:hypothetical protein